MTRIAVALANLLALALLCAVIAYWGWAWFGPARFHAPPPVVDDPLSALAVSPPFGATSAPAVAPTAVAPSVAGDARLLGVLAEAGGRGQALFRFPDGSARLVSVGDALGNGATLVAVQVDGVRLRDEGGERTIALRGQAPVAAATTSARAGASPSSACAVPPDFKGSVVRLNAELVQGLMQSPDALRRIADPQEGGLVIRDESGFAQLLGMRKGDRVAQANGIALRAPDDVIVAVLRPLAASQPVRISGMRGNEARELLVLNASVCR